MKLPIMFIQGKKDKLIDASLMNHFVKQNFDFASIQYHVFDTSGHMPFYKCPGKTNHLILDFVSRCRDKGHTVKSVSFLVVPLQSFPTVDADHSRRVRIP
jgi:hypothetical protein